MASKVSVTFTMDSDAFHDPDGSYGDEASRILHKIADSVRTKTGGKILDINGNTIGKWAVR
jgi:hypothetical protein